MFILPKEKPFPEVLSTQRRAELNTDLRAPTLRPLRAEQGSLGTAGPRAAEPNGLGEGETKLSLLMEARRWQHRGGEVMNVLPQPQHRPFSPLLLLCLAAG